jgi:hypothetical protein
MDKELQSAFELIKENKCLEIISDSEFDIYDSDDKQRCFILLKNDNDVSNEQLFKVINPNKQDIRFLAIDKCLLFDNDKLKRCDCIIYNKKDFCFIELKKVEIKRHRNSAKKTARRQLYSTIKFFIEKVNLKNMSLEAYLCVGYKSTNPANLASSQSAKLEFEEQLNTKLYNGCQKTFDE